MQITKVNFSFREKKNQEIFFQSLKISVKNLFTWGSHLLFFSDLPLLQITIYNLLNNLQKQNFSQTHQTQKLQSTQQNSRETAEHFFVDLERVKVKRA